MPFPVKVAAVGVPCVAVRALAMAAGADVAVDYRRDNLVERIREITEGQGVDRIVEVDFAANAAQDFALIAPEGTIVVYGSGAPEIAVPFVPAILKNVRVSFFIVYHLNASGRAAAIAQLTQWLEAGALQHNIALRLPLEHIAQAHEVVESGRVIGNVVLQLDAQPGPCG